MSKHFQLIYSELLEEGPEFIDMPVLADFDSQSPEMKISALQILINREKVRQNRCNSLYYIFLLGKWLVVHNLTIQESKLSSHYYYGSKRMYFLFEKDPSQIMRTKSMTLMNVAKISVKEFKELLEAELIL